MSGDRAPAAAGRLEPAVERREVHAARAAASRSRFAIATTTSSSRCRDTGVGIRRELLPYVFDRFRQADAVDDTQHGGLGLGLAIVRHLVELHGGNVKVRSIEGHGTTFTVTLPGKRVPSGGVPAGQMVFGGGLLLGTPDLPLRGFHALVVDDHQDARELAEAVLQAAGATVATAESAADALLAFETARVDVLVADIGLPGEDGYDLIRQVRQLPNGGTVVAVALTGYARSEDKERALEAGFNRHIVKPAEPAALIMTIRRADRSRLTTLIQIGRRSRSCKPSLYPRLIVSRVPVRRSTTCSPLNDDRSSWMRSTLTMVERWMRTNCRGIELRSRGGHRFANEMRLRADVHADIVARGLAPVDVGGAHEVDAAARLDDQPIERRAGVAAA